jgi:hypothetical protein
MRIWSTGIEEMGYFWEIIICVLRNSSTRDTISHAWHHVETATIYTIQLLELSCQARRCMRQRRRADVLQAGERSFDIVIENLGLLIELPRFHLTFSVTFHPFWSNFNTSTALATKMKAQTVAASSAFLVLTAAEVVFKVSYSLHTERSAFIFESSFP